MYTPTGIPLRDRVDLRQWASPVENQGHLGSCVSNAIVGAYELMMNQQAAGQYKDLSRLFVYYNARFIESTLNEDTGIYLRDGILAIKNKGVCLESLWPYDILKYKVEPSPECYEDAKHRTIKNYYRIDGVDQSLDALNSNRPVVSSISIYKNFDIITDENNTLFAPIDLSEESGGHAICLVGYDLPKRMLLARNSYGTIWGMAGYFWLPFEYMKNNTLDQWVFDIDLN